MHVVVTAVAVAAVAVATLAVAALLAGCTVFAGTPAPQDPNAGGGKGQPVDESGGGIILPGAVETTPTPFAPGVIAGIEMQALAPGGSFQHGEVTFLLSKIESDPRSTVLHWQVSGMPANASSGETAVPAPQLGDFFLQLPDGSLLRAVGAEGGGANGETGEITFPALPEGTRSIVLIIPNQWSGAAETWRVPVNLP